MKIRSMLHLPHSVEDVRAWHDRPGALVRLTPPGLASLEDPAAGGMRTGRIVGARLGPAPLPEQWRPRWVLHHREHDAAAGRFVDQQAYGPWRTWRHEHTIATAGHGTAQHDSAAHETAHLDTHIHDIHDIHGTNAHGTAIHDDLLLELPRGLTRLNPLVEARVRRVFAFRDRQLRDDLAFHARFAGTPRRTIAITGSTGLIGTQLAALLETGGHTVRRMRRAQGVVGAGDIFWDPQTGRLDPADLEGVDVVVNLGGRSIGTRWTPTVQREIRTSRVRGAALLSRTLAGMRNGPSALVQASAIGIYGPRRPGELLTETEPGGEGFLADLVRDWEGSTYAAAEAGVRVAALRTGLVLSDGGGPLLPQLPLFFAGAGGRLTESGAMVSWIALDDVVRAFAHAALTPTVHGPLNAVAPQPVSAGEFARTLGRVLGRPALLPVPAVGPRLVLGSDAADQLIRTDQDVSDARLRSTGFEPAHVTLEQALRHALWR